MPAFGGIEKVVIFDERMYHGNGIVKRWADLLTTHFVANTIAVAPDGPERVSTAKEPFHLKIKEGISGDVEAVGPRQILMTIESAAPHTLFVIKGTTGPIYAEKAWDSGLRGAFEGGKRQKGFWLWLNPTGPVTLSVGGQTANNFLLKGWRRTARNHSSIRGRTPDFILNPPDFQRRV